MSSTAERYICRKCEKEKPCILIFDGDCAPFICPCSTDGTKADWEFYGNEEDVNISVLSGTKMVNINIHDNHLRKQEETDENQEEMKADS